MRRPRRADGLIWLIGLVAGAIAAMVAYTVLRSRFGP
jgi:hypothetical protein